MFCSFLVVLIISFTGCYGEKAVCTTQKKYIEASGSYDAVSTYCDFGCCGYYPNQYCCTVSVEVAVGGFAGALGGVCLLLMILHSCCKKCKKNQVTSELEDSPRGPPQPGGVPYRPRTPHHTHISVVYAGQYGPGFAWGAARPPRGRPVKPPVYRPRHQGPPPPYPNSSSSSSSMSSLRITQSSLPGAMPDECPEPSPNTQTYVGGPRPPDMDPRYRRTSIIGDIESELDEAAGEAPGSHGNFAAINNSNSPRVHFTDHASTNPRRGSVDSGGSSKGRNTGGAAGEGSAGEGGGHHLLPLRIRISHGLSNSSYSPASAALHTTDQETARGVNPYLPVEVAVQGRAVSINPFIPECVELEDADDDEST